MFFLNIITIEKKTIDLIWRVKLKIIIIVIIIKFEKQKRHTQVTWVQQGLPTQVT
jgi:hypothetical protein